MLQQSDGIFHKIKAVVNYEGNFMMNSEMLQGPAAEYKHDDHNIKNLNSEFQENQTYSQRISDWLAKMVGSWTFIIYQSVVIVGWGGTNAYMAYIMASHGGPLQPWDPYPFILLNLMLSFQAAYTGPVVMMSQNRQVEKDRLMAELDYEINRKAEEEIKVIMDHLVFQDTLILKVLAQLEKPDPDSPLKCENI
jgi:uncharacterized membrane protein